MSRTTRRSHRYGTRVRNRINYAEEFKKQDDLF